MGVRPIADVLVVETDRGLWRHQPSPLLDDRPLEGCLLPFVAYDLFEVVVVENAAHDVLRPGLRTSLQQRDLQTGFGHRDRRRRAGRSGAYDDRVEFLVV